MIPVPFDPDVQKKGSYQKILQVLEWKINVQTVKLFSWFISKI
jgi:hypothetical protein